MVTVGCKPHSPLVPGMGQGTALLGTPLEQGQGGWAQPGNPLAACRCWAHQNPAEATRPCAEGLMGEAVKGNQP